MDTHMADNDNAQSRLTSIPLEVLLQITSHLTTPDYGNLRRTCKAIEASLFNAFSREFFTKRQFMFTEFSLQALLDISKSRLSTSLKYVIFGLEQPNLNHLPTLHRTGNQSTTHFKQNRLLQEYVDYRNFINTCQDIEMLAEAFSHLGSLERVEIRDFYSRSRRRDYPNVEWKSYGVSTFEQSTGCQLGRPRRNVAPGIRSDDLPEQLGRTFLSLLRALGKAGSQPTHFQVILRESSLDDRVFSVPKYSEGIVLPVLANLRTLFLDINNIFPTSFVSDDNQPTQCPNYLLRNFLAQVHQLEHLRLNFHSYGREWSNNLLAWFAMPVSTPASNTISDKSDNTQETLLLAAPPPIKFHSLKQFDIGMTYINPEIMVELIQKYQATLRIISFHKVSLWRTEPVKRGDSVDVWGEFFTQLSKLDLKLSAVNMSFIAQVLLGPERIQQIRFEGSRNPLVRNWAGTDIQSGLRDFISEIKVDRSGDESETSESDNSNNSDDSDDDQD